jgi:hypothetical protein
MAIITLNNNSLINADVGKVLQVVSTTKTDTFTLATGGNVFTDITGLSASITPSSTNSKVYINFAITYGNSTAAIVKAKLVRNSTDISIGDANGSRQRATVGNYNGVANIAMIQTIAQNFIDSPSTISATTYKLQIATENATLYVNRNSRNTNSASDGTYTSSITLMEIQA